MFKRELEWMIISNHILVIEIAAQSMENSKIHMNDDLKSEKFLPEPVSNNTRTEDLPDADRQGTESEDLVHTQKELTSFGDTVAVRRQNRFTGKKISDMVDQNDPYPDQLMGPVLSRVYRVADVTWSSTSGQGTLLSTLRFPELLFNQVNIADKLSHFQFFQCKGIRVELRLNTTQFHAGKIMISHLPYWNSATTGDYAKYKTETLSRQSMNRPALISANTAETCSYVIENVTPHNFLNLNQYPDIPSWTSYYGEMLVSVMNPLFTATPDTETTTIDISVFASFIDPHVTGMCLSRISPAFASNERKELLEKQDEILAKQIRPLSYQNTPHLYGAFAKSKIELQSLKAERKQMSEDESLITKISNAALPIVKTFVGLEDENSSEISQMMKLISVAGLLDKPSRVDKPTLVQQVAWRDQNQTKGLDSSIKLALDPENTVANMTDTHFISQIIQKPTFVGTVTCSAMTPKNTVMARIPVDPLYGAYTQFPSGYVFEPTYFAYIARLFRFWRGSVRVHLDITASRFTTARIRIAWHPYWNDVTTTFPSGGGDVISKIIDIAGDTTVDLAVPYLAANAWLPIRNYSDNQDSGFGVSNGMISISLVNQPRVTQSAADSSVFVNIWYSAGKDVQFAMPYSKSVEKLHSLKPTGSLLDKMYSKKKNVVNKETVAEGLDEVVEPMRPPKRKNIADLPIINAEPQCDFIADDWEKKDFPPLITAQFSIDANLCMGENVNTLNDLLKKYTYHTTVTSGVTGTIYDPWYDEPNSTTHVWSRYDYMAVIKRMFLFWRGSTRVVSHHMANSNNGNCIRVELITGYKNMGAYTTESYYRNTVPVMMLEPSKYNYQGYEIPYYYPYGFVETLPHMNPDINNLLIKYSSTADITLECEISAGDDFQLLWPSACPYVSTGTV